MTDIRRTSSDAASGTPEPSRGERRRWAALLVLCVALLVVTLDNTILNVALPTLVRDLGASSSALQWIVDAYALVFAGLMLVAGSTADRVGRKKVLLAGLVVFGGSSAWAAFSGSTGNLVAARAVMGAGAAMMMPATLSLINAMFRDPGERRVALGGWAATSGLGIAIGPVAGGLLLAHFWWGSIFLVNVPVTVLAVALALPLVPDSRNPRAQRPDPLGAVLSALGLGALVWAVIEAPARGWSSPLVLAVGAGGLAVLACFAVWERTTRHPMLDPALFRRRRFSVATAAIALAMFALFGALFVLTQYLQFDLRFSAIGTGVRILPVAGVLALTAPLATLAVRRVGNRLVVAAGLLVVAGGLAQLSQVSAGSGYLDSLPGLLLLGLGAGLVTPSALDSIMSTLTPEQSGIGSAANGVSVQVGGALGVAVVGSLLATRYQGRLGPLVLPYHLPRAVTDTILGSLGGALAVAQRAGGQAGLLLTRSAREAFLSGMGLGLLVAATVAAAGALVALAWLPARGPDSATGGTGSATTAEAG